MSREKKYLNFGDRLRSLRMKAGETQQSIADRLDLNRNTYKSWEEGIARPKHEDATTLASFFEIPIGDFLANDALDLDLKSKNKNALSSEGQGIDNTLAELIAKTNEAVDAAVKASLAATRVAELLGLRLSDQESRIAENEARIGAVYRWLGTSDEIDQALSKDQGQIEAELSTAYRNILEEKKTGIHVAQGT